MKKLFILLSLLLSATLWSQSPQMLLEIDQLFNKIEADAPGLAVAVELDGRVIYNKAFGSANLEFGIPNTTSTIFECGSVSKQFVAAAILLLAKEGKLSLSDDVRKYVPELPQYDATITIDMLLAHTSGLKDWGALYTLTGWPRGTRVYTQALGYDIIFKQRSTNFYPGSQYSYSNSNYMMLVLITERVSGMTLQEYTEKFFFGPLGMKDTRWRENHRTIVEGRATAYTKNKEEYLLNMPLEDLHGPGGLLSTTSDLLKWNTLYTDHSILGEEYSLNRIESRKINSGESVGYAAGLRVGKRCSFDEVAHSGATGGYRTWLAWYPEKKLTIAILSNYAKMGPKDYGNNIADIVFGYPVAEKKAAKKSSKVAKNVEKIDVEPYLGYYYSEDIDATYLLKRRGNRIVLERKAGESILLNHVSGLHFTSVGGITYHFVKNKKGDITGINVSISRASDVPFIKR